MRFASFNVQNLFARPRALNQATWAEGQPILDAFAEFNSLIEHVAYSPADKTRMIQLLVQLDVYRVDNGIVRRNRTPTPAVGLAAARTAGPSMSSTTTRASKSSPIAAPPGPAGLSSPRSPSTRSTPE